MKYILVGIQPSLEDLDDAKRAGVQCAKANDRPYYIYRVIGRVERDGSFTDAHKLPEDSR